MAARRNSLFLTAAAIALGAGTANAADYSPPPQPSCYDQSLIAAGRAPPGAVPCYTPPPVVVEEFAAWYLRGDIGFSNQKVKSLENPAFTGFDVVHYGFDAAPIFGLGIGYYFNDWLRFDITGEYRGRANFHGLENYGTFTDEYHGSKSEWLALANAYIDLGTWWSITPFVGAGVGFSRNTIHDFTDINTPNAGVAFADDATKWNFAWALHAGLAYKVTKNFAVEFSYRYVHLGDAISGDIRTYDGTNAVFNPTTFHDLSSHDFRIGLRVNLDAFRETSYQTPYQPTTYQQPVSVYAAAPAPQPQYAPPPPAPVYAPQPQYAPPPPQYAYPQQPYYPPPNRRY